MKIEHITYDKCRASGSNSSPPSSGPAARGYPSTRTASLSDQEIPSDVRPVTMWPRHKDAGPSNMVTPEESRDGRRKKLIKKRPEEKPRVLPPILRHKGKFFLERASSDSENNVPMHKLQKLRRDITDGKLELVAGRLATAEKDNRIALPQPAQKPRAASSSTQDSAHKKTTLTSSRVAEYLGAGVDMIDETRRSLQGKFREPFENLSYPTFSLSRKTSISSEASEKSFFCQGEEPQEQRGDARAEGNKRRQRLSGDGTDPWTQPAPNCRLCNQYCIAGVRGMCSRCERDLRQPKVPGTALPSISTLSLLEDIKPTPPLKDHKSLSYRKPVNTNKPLPQIDNQVRESQDFRPIVPVKDDIRLVQMRNESKPAIHHPNLNRQISMTAEIENQADDGENEDEFYRRWQTRAMREEFDRTHGMFGRFSQVYEDDEPVNQEAGSSDNRNALMNRRRAE